MSENANPVIYRSELESRESRAINALKSYGLMILLAPIVLPLAALLAIAATAYESINK